MLPGFYRRVYAELDAMIGSNKFYEELKGLLKLLLLRKPGDGVIHCNISSWVGGMKVVVLVGLSDEGDE